MLCSGLVHKTNSSHAMSPSTFALEKTKLTLRAEQQTKGQRHGLPPACGLLSAAGTPAPNPGGPSQIPGSSRWSRPPWACRRPASGRNRGCSSRSECGCRPHTQRRPVPRRRCRVAAADRGCVHTGSCKCEAPPRTRRAGCSRSSTAATGGDSASRTGSCGDQEHERDTI